jgi:hypothetical protein
VWFVNRSILYKVLLNTTGFSLFQHLPILPIFEVIDDEKCLPNNVSRMPYLSIGKGHEYQGCCVHTYNNHSCNANEGCTYQGQNTLGFHCTGIAINIRDVFFKDRFMLAPNLILVFNTFVVRGFWDILALKRPQVTGMF